MVSIPFDGQAYIQHIRFFECLVRSVRVGPSDFQVHPGIRWERVSCDLG